MPSAKGNKLIRIYGVTIASPAYRTRPYGHGSTKIEKHNVEYVDYFVDDLIIVIKQQKLSKVIVEKLRGGLISMQIEIEFLENGFAVGECVGRKKYCKDKAEVDSEVLKILKENLED